MATDTVYSETPTVDSSITQLLFFSGLNSLVWDVYVMKTDKEFVNVFEDTIYQIGTPKYTSSEHNQLEITGRLKYLFCAYVIGNWCSE